MTDRYMGSCWFPDDMDNFYPTWEETVVEWVKYEFKSNNSMKKYVCKLCGNDRFIVGDGEYETTLKCPECKWEILVHSG